MKVRYVCDSCRSLIAEFDHESITYDRLGLTELDAEEWPQFVQQTAEAVVLSVLCDECASFLDAAEISAAPIRLH
ncbi:MAG: anti-sigma-F factor Fin [Bacillota bacterium]|jgi:hypothetical protein